MTAFSTALALSSGSEKVRCHVNKALAHQQLGENEQGLRHYDAALSLDPPWLPPRQPGRVTLPRRPIATGAG